MKLEKTSTTKKSFIHELGLVTLYLIPCVQYKEENYFPFEEVYIRIVDKRHDGVFFIFIEPNKTIVHPKHLLLIIDLT